MAAPATIIQESDVEGGIATDTEPGQGGFAKLVRFATQQTTIGQGAELVDEFRPGAQGGRQILAPVIAQPAIESQRPLPAPGTVHGGDDGATRRGGMRIGLNFESANADRRDAHDDGERSGCRHPGTNAAIRAGAGVHGNGREVGTIDLGGTHDGIDHGDQRGRMSTTARPCDLRHGRALIADGDA